MRKLAGVAVVAVGALGLAGCGLVAEEAAPAKVKTECEITHAGDLYAVGGVTDQPEGTVFTLVVRDTIGTQTVEMPVRAGSVQVHGVIYGDGYAPGVLVFGTTQEQIVSTVGPVSAKVVRDGHTVC